MRVRAALNSGWADAVGGPFLLGEITSAQTTNLSSDARRARLD
jgi:hypothetical protein